MAERMITEAFWGYHDFVLANAAVAVKGCLAVIDTGNAGIVKPPGVATGLVALGIFMESLTGDGVQTVQVKLHRELQASWWDNDTVAPIAITDRGAKAYYKDDHTVTITAAAHSVAGMILDVSATKGVLVTFNYPAV